MRVFLKIFLTGYLLLMGVVFVGAFVFDPRALTCRANGYIGESHMAYCGHSAFGDYDLGAFYFDLEDLNATIANAEILFLGNSRIQFAVSNDAALQALEDLERSFYFMGFGYNEGDSFVKKLAETYKFRPKVLVINTDPFFGKTSSVAKALISGGKTIEDYEMKKTFQSVHRWIGSFRLQDEGSFFRDQKTGQWLWQDSLKFPDTPMPLKTEDARKISYDPSYHAALSELSAAFGVPPSCIVLTHVPNDQVDARDMVLDLAQRSGAKFILPQSHHLKTLDGSHLDKVSASLWSERFFEDFNQSVQGCFEDPALTNPSNQAQIPPTYSNPPRAGQS